VETLKAYVCVCVCVFASTYTHTHTHLSRNFSILSECEYAVIFQNLLMKMTNICTSNGTARNSGCASVACLIKRNHAK